MGKVYNGIMGLIVGDALGVPFEFTMRDTFKATDMVGFGTHGQPAGTWSDDTSLTLATLESIGRLGKVDLNDIMYNFALWLFNGDFTANGYVFDVGFTTKKAIQKYIINQTPPESCGGSSEMDNGNGSLMRILPLAFMNYSMQEVYNVSALTHAHDISQVACGIYCNIASYLNKGLTKHQAVAWALSKSGGVPAQFERIEVINTAPVNRDEIKSTGYVIDTLEAALWCFLNTGNYKDCVLTAVNLGGDTDTVAAVAGGLAGIYYGIGGESGIPEEWVNKIARNFYIKELCDDFERTIVKGAPK